MDQPGLLRFVASVLDELGIPYFVTGSIAGMLYGESRVTNDIDIVVDMRAEHIDPFLARFSSPQFHVSRDAVLDAIKNRFQFNIISMDMAMPYKIDFIVSPSGTHDRERFRRIQRHKGAVGVEIAYCSPEDLLLKKLEFHKASGSVKHLRDAAGILKISGATLDWKYLENWADWLDVYKSWQAAQALAKTPETET